MIIIKPDLSANGLTYSQRRRLITLLWALASNSAFPFILGFIVALISITHTFTETITIFDKTGFGFCVQSELPISAANKD